MDSEKQLSLVIYEEDPSKQKPLSPLKTMVSQDINNFSFSAVTLVQEDTSTLEKATRVRARKYSDKDMITTRLLRKENVEEKFWREKGQFHKFLYNGSFKYNLMECAAIRR